VSKPRTVNPIPSRLLPKLNSVSTTTTPKKNGTNNTASSRIQNFKVQRIDISLPLSLLKAKQRPQYKGPEKILIRRQGDQEENESDESDPETTSSFTSLSGSQMEIELDKTDCGLILNSENEETEFIKFLKENHE